VHSFADRRGQPVPAYDYSADHCGDGAQCIACPNGGGPHTRPDCSDKHACGFRCESFYGDCNGLAADGCEVDLTSDPSNCGACGVQCPHGCVGAVCALRWDGESHVAGLTDGQPTSSLRQTTWTSWDGGTLDVRQGPVDGGVPNTLASGR
jgi:hypothetical protein